MPIYIFEKDGKRKEVVLRMNEPKVYFGESGKEEGWVRVFTKPRMSVDSKIDPFSEKDFVNKTGAKRGSYGDLIEASKELSEKRAEKTGKDPIKEKYYNDWSKSRKGKKHPSKAKEDLKNKLKNNKHFDIED